MSSTAKSKRRPPAPRPYHHGDLRRVLIDAALRLAEEGGAEQVSVREAARRAGVSPGAPVPAFRDPGRADDSGCRGGAAPLPGRD